MNFAPFTLDDYDIAVITQLACMLKTIHILYHSMKLVKYIIVRVKNFTMVADRGYSCSMLFCVWEAAELSLYHFHWLSIDMTMFFDFMDVSN